MNRRRFLAAGAALAAAPLVAAPAPRKIVPGIQRLLVQRGMCGYSLLSEDGKREQVLSDLNGRAKDRKWFVTLSPDGSKLAWVCNVEVKDRTVKRLCVRDLTTDGIGSVVESDGFRWPSDWVGNTHVFVNHGASYKIVPPPELLNVTTFKLEPVEVSKEGEFCGASADGTVWLLEGFFDGRRRLSVRGADGEVMTLDMGETHPSCKALSPDGKSLLHDAGTASSTCEKDRGVFLRVVGGKDSKRVHELPKRASVTGLCWAPDGTRFAFSWHDYSDAAKTWLAQGVFSQTLDGSDLRHLLKCDPEDHKRQIDPRVLCWR